MSISVIDYGTARSGEGMATLDGLHEMAGQVDRGRLPCRVLDPELWFADTPADVEYAKELCRDCPVRELCLTGAVQRREPWGIWGGQLFERGVVVPRKRPRGRPRKDGSQKADTSAA